MTALLMKDEKIFWLFIAFLIFCVGLLAGAWLREIEVMSSLQSRSSVVMSDGWRYQCERGK